jgi:hypothetical protein
LKLEDDSKLKEMQNESRRNVFTQEISRKKDEEEGNVYGFMQLKVVPKLKIKNIFSLSKVK